MDQARLFHSGIGKPPDPEGMAFIYEDNAASKPIAFTTVRFAREFCEADLFYTWRKA
jgi:hypothetical protein